MALAVPAGADNALIVQYTSNRGCCNNCEINVETYVAIGCATCWGKYFITKSEGEQRETYVSELQKMVNINSCK